MYIIDIHMNKKPVCLYVLHNNKKIKTQSLFDEFLYSFNTQSCL